VEGVINPANGNAYGQAGNLGLGNAAGNNRRNGDEHELNGPKQYFPYRGTGKPQQSAQGALNKPPAIRVSVLQTSPHFFPAMQREPFQEIPATLAPEDDELRAGRQLAARFVRPAAEAAQAAPRRSKPWWLRPFLTAGVLFVAVSCTSAVYFAKSGGLAPAGSAYAATVIEGPSEALPDALDEDRELSPAAASAAGDSWATAVETFRTLVRAQAALAPQGKADELN